MTVNISEDSGSGPRKYHWTTHMFYCTDCEAPRFASMEAFEHQESLYPEDQLTYEEMADSFDFCLACAYGPEAWANECSNPEGEWGDYKTLPERIRQTAIIEGQDLKGEESN